jgi:oligoendopeptidase F
MKAAIFSISFLAFIAIASGQTERDQIEDIYKWNLTKIYPSDEAWHSAKEALVEEMDKMDAFKGNLTLSARHLLKALEFDSYISRESDKLGLYASSHSDLDTRNMSYLGMYQEFQQIRSEYFARTAYMKPEILSVDWSVINSYLEEEPALKPYEKRLKDLFRMEEHTLGEAEGRIMSLSGMVYGVPESVYSTFTNAELPYPSVILSNGEEVVLNLTGYVKYRALPNRKDRALVFKSFFENLEKFQATLGELLYGGIKKDVYRSKAQNYNTSLEAVLDRNKIPEEVYHALIDNVNSNLSAFHRYLKIKKRMMGLDTLRYLDLYAPAVKDVRLSYDFKEAQDILMKAFTPLGQDYISVMQKAFNERWIDVYTSIGKMSGAYSTGFYDGHPLVLLNYNDQYEDMSTAAHELGHAMHSYFSNKNQPFPTAWYTIFVAEVASTFNEVLLFDYIINDIEDDDIRLYVLRSWLDVFKVTLFRQTQFAEYELRIHEAVEKGIPLTGEYLSNLYSEIVKKYYGHDQGVCIVDDYIHMEWAFISHFYYNYYVYQYSTSFTASVSLAKSLLVGEEGMRERYLDLLGAGGSDYPIELLKKAGVDMTGSQVFNSTIAAMNELLDEIEKILDQKDRQGE